MTKMKKKLEHWEIVSLLLMVYDFYSDSGVIFCSTVDSV